MVHMVQQEPSLSPAEKTFFRLTCAGEGRVSSYWWHQGDAYLSSYEKAKKEGAVRVGITIRKKRFGKSAGEKYLQAFQRQYSFLRFKFKRIGGSRERERVLAEMSAGLIKYYVVTISETAVPIVVQAKLPLIFDWGKVGIPKSLIQPKNVGSQ